MRLHFQERPWDLFLLLGYTILVSLALVLSGTGNLLAILLIFIAPGYVVIAALFPSDEEIDWIERLALSAGLSLAVVPFLGLFLNFTPFGIRFAPIAATIALFTTLVGLVAYSRRMRLPAEARLAATLTIQLPRGTEYAPVDKALAVGLAVSVIAAAAALAYVILSPRPGEPLTEFYILGPGGSRLDLSTRLNVSEPASVIIGIANHELTAMNYTVRVDLVGVESVYNSSKGYNETLERNRTTWSTFSVAIRAGETFTYPYTFAIDRRGLWEVEFLLFKEGDLETSYRDVHLLIDVDIG